MIGDIAAADEIYIVCGYTDMRKSIDGLCAIVKEQLHMDPYRRALYLKEHHNTTPYRHPGPAGDHCCGAEAGSCPAETDRLPDKETLRYLQ